MSFRLFCHKIAFQFARNCGTKIECSMGNIIPSFLKSGDRVAICATARWLNPGEETEAVSLLEAKGFKVEVHKDVFTKFGQLAGDDEVRAKALQQLLDDTGVRAILIARGGYGTARILDKLDFKKWLENPSWICGYSDITALLGHSSRLGVASIHSTMPISFPVATGRAKHGLLNALMGELHEINWETSAWHEKTQCEGVFVGGNLSVLYSLMGSSSFPNLNGAILFIEDVDEMIYHIDRMLLALTRSGVLEGLRAIVVGGMTQMRDNTREFGFSLDNPFGKTMEEVLIRWSEELGVKIFFGFPAGHQNDNCAFYHARKAVLLVEGTRCRLTWID